MRHGRARWDMDSACLGAYTYSAGGFKLSRLPLSALTLGSPRALWKSLPSFNNAPWAIVLVYALEAAFRAGLEVERHGTQRSAAS